MTIMIGLSAPVTEVSRDLFYSHGLTVIPTGLSNDIHYKVCDELSYPLSNLNDVTDEVWEWINDFIHIILGMWLLIRKSRDYVYGKW